MDAENEYTVLGRFEPGSDTDPDGDAATLAAMAAQGSDMTQPTRFIHYLTFREEEQARTAAEALAVHLGYDTYGFEPDEAVPYWSVRAETDRVPTLENVHRMRLVMLTAAERYDGEYHGWEAALQK